MFFLCKRKCPNLMLRLLAKPLNIFICFLDNIYKIPIYRRQNFFVRTINSILPQPHYSMELKMGRFVNFSLRIPANSRSDVFAILDNLSLLKTIFG